MADAVPGPLRSVLLRGSTRLQGCAQSDSDHVMPYSTPGPHIDLINQGLNEVARLYPGQGYLSVPLGGNQYGDATINAVLALKKKHLLYTRGTTSFDEITGIRTIRKIDELLKAKELPDPTPTPTPTPTVTPKTTTNPTLALSGQCQIIGQRMDNRNAGDLGYAEGEAAVKTGRTAWLTNPLRLVPDAALLATMASGINAMTLGGSVKESASGAVLAEPQKLIYRFSSGGGSGDWVWAPGSPVSEYAIKAPKLKDFISQIVRPTVRMQVSHAWSSPVIDDAKIASQIRPSLSSEYPSAGGALAGFIGGIQGFTLKMCGLSVTLLARTFSYRLEAEYYDHFGVDYTDVDRNDGNHPAASVLAAWFVLQHFKSRDSLSRGRYRPFRTVLQVSYGTITDTPI